MTAVIVLVVLAVGWVPAAAVIMRWAAESWSHCHTNGTSGYTWSNPTHCRQYCRPGCWRPDGVVTSWVLWRALALAFVWPVLVPPVSAYYLATRRPTIAARDRRIAELEAELGIDH